MSQPKKYRNPQLLIEDLLSLIEENKDIVDDMEELKVIFKEELGFNDFMFNKGDAKAYFPTKKQDKDEEYE